MLIAFWANSYSTIYRDNFDLPGTWGGGYSSDAGLVWIVVVHIKGIVPNLWGFRVP